MIKEKPVHDIKPNLRTSASFKPNNMKRISFSLIAFTLTLQGALAQTSQGKIVTKQLYSALLVHSGGEDPTRRRMAGL